VPASQGKFAVNSVGQESVMPNSASERGNGGEARLLSTASPYFRTFLNSFRLGTDKGN